jgi:hypothetical protein
MLSSMFWVQPCMTRRGRPLPSGVDQKWPGSGRKWSCMVSKCSAQRTESNDVSHLGVGGRNPLRSISPDLPSNTKYKVWIIMWRNRKMNERIINSKINKLKELSNNQFNKKLSILIFIASFHEFYFQNISEIKRKYEMNAQSYYWHRYWFGRQHFFSSYVLFGCLETYN